MQCCIVLHVKVHFRSFKLDSRLELPNFLVLVKIVLAHI